MPAATLTWLDLTTTDRDRVRRLLDLFNEQGTVDELGLGSLRDLISDALFPGTSVLHTRLRYVLFVPWLYQQLERKRVRGIDIAEEARRMEVKLIDSLAADQDADGGVIGIQARDKLARLPSSVYWACLVRWDIFRPAQSQGWYHRNFDRLMRRRVDVPRADDPGVTWTQEHTWHPRLPEPPAECPREVSFDLTFDEADFVRGRLEETCGKTLLTWLARESSGQPADAFWDDPDALRAGEPIRETIELARRFSLHVEGAPLLYNLQLAERRYELEGWGADARRMDEYKNQLTEWATREAKESPFEPNALWAFAAKQGVIPPEPQRRFVEGWSKRIAEIGPYAVVDDDHLRKRIEDRERQLKGPKRARLSDAGRLLDWSGKVGVGRMAFRWPNVRQLLTDLHRGLAA